MLGIINQYIILLIFLIYEIWSSFHKFVEHFIGLLAGDSCYKNSIQNVILVYNILIHKIICQKKKNKMRSRKEYYKIVKAQYMLFKKSLINNINNLIKKLV